MFKKQLIFKNKHKYKKRKKTKVIKNQQMIPKQYIKYKFKKTIFKIQMSNIQFL